MLRIYINYYSRRHRIIGTVAAKIKVWLHSNYYTPIFQHRKLYDPLRGPSFAYRAYHNQ